MTDKTDVWAVALNLSPQENSDFRRLAASMNSDPADLLRMMVQRVIRLNLDLDAHGLSKIESWVTARKLMDFSLDYGLGALPLDIHPSNLMWPADKPFPWTAEECRAAVLGYEVKWKGDFSDFHNLVRGKWEMVDGYAVLYQP